MTSSRLKDVGRLGNGLPKPPTPLVLSLTLDCIRQSWGTSGYWECRFELLSLTSRQSKNPIDLYPSSEKALPPQFLYDRSRYPHLSFTSPSLENVSSEPEWSYISLN